MESSPGNNKKRSPAFSKVEGGADVNKAEQAIVSDALRQLPSLYRHSQLPPTSDARDTRAAETPAGMNAAFALSHHSHLSHDETSYTLGIEDEELLLQELVNITAGVAPFVSSKTAAAAEGELNTASSAATSITVQGDVLSSTHALSLSIPKDPQRIQAAENKNVSVSKTSAAEAGNGKKIPGNTVPPTPAKAAKSSSAVPSSTAADIQKQKRRLLTSKDEQDILDAILIAVDGQQSSVSGDLTGSISGAKAGSACQTVVKNVQQEEEEEQDAVDRVLEEAKLLSSSTVLCATQRGELVLHIHEHITLRRQVGELSKTIGAATCVALAEVASLRGANDARSPPSSAGLSSSSEQRSIAVAVGTNLGTVALFNQQWNLLGLCGSVEANMVNARGSVVSLSLSIPSSSSTERANEEPTAATGHAKGVFILWSLHTLAPLRVIKDECTVPLLRVQHLHRDSNRVLVLESSGAVKLFQFWKVMSKYILRTTSFTSDSATTPISDMDTLPFPSTFYMRNLPKIKESLSDPASAWNSDNGIPWLIAPPPLPSATAAAAGVSRTSWSTIPDKHLVAVVCSDAVIVYVVEAGLQGAVSAVARHTHPPSSALSNELVRFVPVEQEGVVARVLLCVSWNTEMELILLNLQLPITGLPDSAANAIAASPIAQGIERMALLRLKAPLLQMVPLAGCSVLLLDQNNDAQLMDASVAVMVERHHFASLEYVTFTSRLCGVKYNGTVTSNLITALLLGKEHAYSISVYSWRERLSALVARRKFAEALDLAKGFAEEVALSMVGLSSNAAQRRRELHQYMERIFFAYLESSLKSHELSSSSSNASESLFDVLQHIATYCSTVDALDLLYGSMTRILQQRGLLSHLLYVLEGTMRRGVLTYMPGPLVEHFIDLFVHEKQLSVLEVELGVRSVQPRQAYNLSAQHASPTVATADRFRPAEDDLSGKDRAELALMCLDTDLDNLLRLAQKHQLLRLSVTIMSYRQRQYVEALSYALDEEEAEERRVSTETGKDVSGWNYVSVAVDLVECTLKDCALLPGADIPANEQRPTKKALLEFLLQTNEQGQHNLLRFLRRQPQRAVRVLVFALSDEGLCSPWSGSAEGFCRTQFVSSVFFLLTGGTRTQPRLSKSGNEDMMFGQQGRKPLNLFLIDDEELAHRPGLRKLGAAELALRSFPPYEAVHTFLSGAALFDELFLADGEKEEDGFGAKGVIGGFSSSSSSTVRFDVWVDLVMQDGLFMFQNAETVEERKALQEQLMRFMAPPFIPKERVAAFQPDLSRYRMARCLAALFCKEQRYTEAIRCYIDPVQIRVDTGLQHDVFAMLRGEMQRLQDLKAHFINAAHQLSNSRRSDSDVFDEEANDNNAPMSPPSESHTNGASGEGPSRGSGPSGRASNSSAATTAIDEAIKALQRSVMTEVGALVRIDATALAQFIFDYLPSNHREVMRLLRGSSAAFLDYLDELVAQGDPTVANDIHLQNTYIELLCAHAPHRVFAHLQEKGSSITYDVQLALSAVRKYRIADASIYLLEKTMMIDEAMTVMMNAARTALTHVREEVIAQVTAKTDHHNNEPRTLQEAAATKDNLKASFTSAPAAASASTTATPGEKNKETPHNASPGAISEFLVGAAAVPAAPELLRLISIGKALCQKFQTGHPSGNNGGGGGGNTHSQNPEYWFRLLDVFMVPRRLLCQVLTQEEKLLVGGRGCSPSGHVDEEKSGSDAAVLGGTGMQSELEIAARFAVAMAQRSRDDRHSTSPLPDGPDYRLPPLKQPLTPSQRKLIAALVSVYTQCTSSVLRAMMSSLDLSVVMDKVVQDNKEEAFRPFKPIILDMMASLSFDLEANRLCESATESDVMSLGRELYQKLSTGIVTLSDCCALCHLHLSEPPPASTTEATPAPAAGGPAVPLPSPSAVCVYTCGHAYHTLCCLHAMGPSQQQQQQGCGCYVCAHQRFFSGQRVRDVTTMNASASPATTVTATPADTAAAMRAAAVNVTRMQRRIRQTKVKIDHTEDLYPLLKSYLMWDDSAPSTPVNDNSNAAAVTVAADASSWVLTPSPRVPVTIGELNTFNQGATAGAVATTSTEEKGLDVETLTDAEILELFGSL